MAKEDSENTRTRIINAAEKILYDIGRDNLTIRAVANEAKVQAPAIYRLFEDKVALLDAVVEQGFARYMANDQGYERQLDLVDELRNGWDFHVRFGINNPGLYALMYDHSRYPEVSPAAKFAYDKFKDFISEVASAGLLRVSEDQALFAIFASAAGTVRGLLALPYPRQIDDYCEFIREAMIDSILVQRSRTTDDQVGNALITFKANISKFEGLSVNEKNLLFDWLSNIKY